MICRLGLGRGAEEEEESSSFLIPAMCWLFDVSFSISSVSSLRIRLGSFLWTAFGFGDEAEEDDDGLDRTLGFVAFADEEEEGDDDDDDGCVGRDPRVGFLRVVFVVEFAGAEDEEGRVEADDAEVEEEEEGWCGTNLCGVNFGFARVPCCLAVPCVVFFTTCPPLMLRIFGFPNVGFNNCFGLGSGDKEGVGDGEEEEEDE